MLYEAQCLPETAQMPWAPDRLRVEPVSVREVIGILAAQAFAGLLAKMSGSSIKQKYDGGTTAESARMLPFWRTRHNYQWLLEFC